MRSQHLLAGSALAAVIALSAVGAASADSTEPIAPVESAAPSAPAELSSPDVPADLTSPEVPSELSSPAVPLTPVGPANPVIIQPNPVAPGGQFSVFDGGNCTGTSGIATFRSVSGGSAIPSVNLSTLSNQLGGVGTVPAGTEPGQYEVSVSCQNGGTGKQGPFTGTLTVSSRTPKGGVQTGLGGGIGMDPAETALGAALVAAALTGTIVLGRRRARGSDN
ncbi:hypothetical protein G3I60_19850 [Streptomyces sp. SID13666]|uniref:hypothetical protein n=1 Tax=unclassified Streptomyces TaxID=2593676 RepID=UPI0013BF02F2|nr:MULTISPECIES: hypothetical protein [unclassified Streptomyces]NEA56337.1 hypothetical protein [Streptomyces sp. SID13666]NEA73697.1 hypothetical protein [Streptomyces sp. SID13588]